MSWPSQSPDLNPIENLWYHLKKEISNIKDLPEAIKKCRNSITPAYCKKLSDSMPKRIDATIKNKGSWTKY